MSANVMPLEISGDSRAGRAQKRPLLGNPFRANSGHLSDIGTGGRSRTDMSVKLVRF